MPKAECHPSAGSLLPKNSSCPPDLLTSCFRGQQPQALLQPLDFDLAVPHLVAVILDEDVSALRLAEARDVLELALGDRRLELGRFEIVFEHGLAVEDVRDVLALDDHLAGVPLAGRL